MVKKFEKCLEVTKKSSTFALAFEKSGEKDGSLAQLNRAFDYGSKGCRFESCRSHKDDATTYYEWLHFFCLFTVLINGCKENNVIFL